MSNKTLVLIASIAVVVTVLPGCVKRLSKQQCISMNWYELGMKDGSAGKTKSMLGKEINDCARYKLTVDTNAYAKGWRKGVRQFCQPSNAYDLGAAGRQYNRVCPTDLARNFSHAWRRGLRRFCTPQNGYSVGRSGKDYPNYCAPDLAQAFNSQYRRGKTIYDREQVLRRRINDISRQISHLNRNIRSQRHHINHWRRKLGKNDPNINRESLYRNIDRARDEIRVSQAELVALYLVRSGVEKKLSRLPK